MLNYQLEIVGEESVTYFDHDDEFYVNLPFDRSIYRRAHIRVRDSVRKADQIPNLSDR